MRAALLTNSSAAAAKALTNLQSGQAQPTTSANSLATSQAASHQPEANEVLAKEKGIQTPNSRAEGIFDDSPTDDDKEGATPESVEEKRLPNARKLLSVA